MPVHDFTLVFDRIPDDDGYDRIFEAGCDDTQPEEHPDGTFLLHFMRESDTFFHAVATARRDTEKAGYVPRSLRLHDLAAEWAIPARVGVSDAELRGIIENSADNGFPTPVATASSPIFAWAQVAKWFTEEYGAETAVADFHHQVTAADLAIRALAELSGFPDNHDFVEIFQAA